MNTSQLIRFCIFFLFTTCNILPVSPVPTLSPEDEQMLAQIDEEVDKYVNSLSPQEQEKFWKDVAQLQDAMSNMSEQELEKFINGVFSGEITELPIAKEEPKPEPKPSAPPIPKPAPKPTPAPPVVVQPVVESSAVKDIVETIDTIIDSIETFLQKVQIIPEFESKVERWAQDGDIRTWPKGARWNTVKLQINEFVQKLYKIKDRDVKTKAYKYIDTAISNKTLVNNLKQLMTVLNKHVPTIEAPEFGEIQLSKPSRTGIQETIGVLNESLSLVKIPQELQAIFEGYTSVAEQLKAEEQKAREEALKVRKPRPQPIKPYQPSYPTYEPSYDFDEDEYEPAPAYRPSPPSYQPLPSLPPTPSVSPTQAPRGEKPGAPAKPVTEKEKKAAEEKKKKEDAEIKEKAAKDRAAKQAAAVAETDPVAEAYIDEIGENLEKVITLLDEHNGLLKEMKKHLTDTSPLNNEVALVSLPSAIKNVNRALDKVKTLTRRVNNMKVDAQKKKYRGSLKGKDFDKQFKTLETVAKDIDSIKSTWNSIKDKVSPNKQYAYLGGMSADKADDAVKKAILTPSSLYDLQSAIAKLLDAKNLLEKGPAPKKMEPGRRRS